MSNFYLLIKRVIFTFLLSVLTTITIFAQVADFTVNTSSQCISGNNFVFTNASSGGATAYQWSFGDGTFSSATNPTKSYTAYGTYSVQLIVTIGGNNYYINKTVEVNPMPQCSFTYLAATSTGNSYTFLSTSSIGSGSMNYSWDFGDGGTATSSNPTHTYSANGAYVVTLTVTSDKGCSCSIVQTVIVTISSGGTAPVFSFNMNNSSQCLTGNSFTFTNTTPAISGATYRWTFGDGGTSNAVSPVHSYAAAGTYSVSLIATISGTDYYQSQIITVNAMPTVSISGTACTGNILTATIGGGTPGSLVWKNGATVVQNTTPTWNTSYTVVAGGNGAGINPNQLQTAKGIYVDKLGNLYVIDNYQSRVQKWAPGATTGITVATGLQITGVGVDDAGNVYVADDINNWVKKFAPGATTGVLVAGGNGGGSAANQLDNPRGNLFIDASGNIYINDFGNRRIQKWAVNATTGTTVAGGNGAGSAANQLNYEGSFFVDAAGNIYVADGGNRRIQLWTVGATTGITVAGGNGAGSAANQFDAGADLVYVDANGNIYAIDHFQGRIQLWLAGATSGSTVFGGAYGSASFDQPFVYMNMNTGDIFVLDQSNNRVLKYAVANISNTYTALTAGTYTATVTSFAGCNATSTTFVVSAAPTVYPVVGASDLCAGSSITLTDTANLGGIWNSSNTSVATVNGSGIVTGVAAGTTTISYSLTNGGCTASVTKTITVNALPTATIASGTYCTGNSIAVSTSSNNISSIQWKNGSTIVSTSIPTWSTSYTTVAGTTAGASTGYPIIVGSTVTTLIDPQSVYLDNNKNVYIIDNIGGTPRVVKWTPGASYGIVVATDTQITGIGFDKDGNLYTVDDVHNWVLKWTPGATSGVVVAGGNGTGSAANQFHDSGGQLFIDDNYNIYVCDKLNNRVQKWALGATNGVTVAGGNGSGAAANQLNAPTSIFVDTAGTVYVVDANNARIQKWLAGATTGTTVAGGNGSGVNPNQLYTPRSVYVDNYGTLYISAFDFSTNNTIIRWEQGASTGSVILTVQGSQPVLSENSAYFDVTTGAIYIPKVAEDIVAKYSTYSTSTSFTPISSGSYTAVINTFGGCSAMSNTVTVNTTPVVGAITGASNVCVGSTINLSNTTPSGIWSTSNSSIATVNASGVITGVSAGMVTITYTVNNAGCTASVTKYIVVNALPTINLTGGGSCASTLTANISGGVASNLIWALNGTPQDTVYATYNTSATTVAGGNGNGNAANQFSNNQGIFVDAFGNLYVADQNNSRVQKFASGSTTGVTVAGGNGNGNAANQLSSPTAIFVDGNGSVYVLDNGNSRVQKFTAGSTIGVTVAGGNGNGSAANQLGGTTFGLYVDATGNVYVSDLSNSRVQRWDVGATSGVVVAGGNAQGSAANQLSNPFGIFVDASANVYIADGGNNRVQKWASGASSGTTVAGITGIGGPPDSAHLSFVTGVFVDATGSIFISDYFNRIVRWQEGASYGTSLVGSNFSGGSGATELQYPFAFSFASNGDLYVSDAGNNRVQKFSLNTLSNTFTPAGAGTYSVTANSFASCTSTASANVSSLGVAPTIAISTGVSCGNATICAGSSITFNSSITNGGASPAIQWKVNGNSVATGASFTTTSLNNNDVVTAVLTSNAACPNPNPVTSNPITITTKAAPAVTITGSGCTGGSLSLTGTGLAGSTITWSVGGVPVAASAPSIDTNAVTVAGGLSSGSGATQLNNQQGIFVDASNNLYIADFGNDRVQKWVNGGATGVTIAGGNGQGLASNQTGGYGLFVDKNNNLFTVEALHRVQKWTPSSTNGILVAGTGFSGSSATQFTLPKSVYIDDCGNMYVADTYNHRIQKFANGSTVGVTVAGIGISGNSSTQLSYPTHVQVDAQGNIYVADNGNSRIQRFAAGGTTGVTVAGTGTAGSANNQLDNAWGMYVDGGGNIYVADTYNNRIMYWANGATTGVKIAGTGSYGSGANGLNYPTHVFVDATGNVYVSDSHNNRVQKFAAIAPISITPLTTGTYTVTVSNTYGCSVTSNTITVTNCVTPTISIASASGGCQTNVCAGGSVTFTASITNGGASPTYQWKVNGVNAGTNSNTFTTSSLNNNDVVTCDIKNNDIGAYPAFVTSNTITVTVNPLPTINLSGTNCINAPITVSTNTAVASVVWTLSSTAVATSNPSWNTTGITVAGGANGNAANQLRSPTDILVDNSGNIYVADLFNNRIQKFPSNSSAGTNAVTVAGQSDGTGGSSLTTLSNPHGFTLDANGNVYITNSANHRIDKWLSNATSGTTVAGTGTNGSAANQFFIPRRMVLDACGNMYITDTYNHRVQKWAVGASTGVTVAGGNGLGNAANQLNYPTDVALDALGNVYVADADNNRIQKFPPNSTSSTNGITVAGTGSAGSALNQLDNPQGIYVNGAGNLFIADANNVRIMYWANGALTGTLIAGGNGYGNASNQLNYPTNITLDQYGNIYVADEHNDRIQKFTVATSSYTPTTAGAYTVTATSNNGCTSSQNITINTCAAPPSPSFTVNSGTQCITSNNFVFTNTSVFTGSATYLWSFGDGATATTNNASHTYAAAGYYLVQLKLTVAGIDYYSSQTVMVGAQPVASFNTIAGTGVGTAYTFISTSTIASGTMSYAWTFGDGGTSTLISPQHTYTSAATYNVKLVVTSDTGCKDSITQTITVSAGGGSTTPIPGFTVNTITQCITGNNYVFTNSSSSPVGTTYRWTFGDGTTSTLTSPTKTYTTSGYYNVTLIATFNGIDYYTNQTVVVKPIPVASFTYTTNTGNGSSYTFNSTSTIASGSMNYSWTFGDGGTATSSNPQHTYAANGTYTVQLTVTSDAGCASTTSQSVVVNISTGGGGGTNPIPSFTVNTTQQCLQGNSFVFTNTSSAPVGTTYLWQFGDGITSTLTSPTHVYTVAGYYYVQMIATYNGQSYYASGQSIIVGAKPNVSFYSTGGTVTGNAYTFYNTSTITNGNMNYAWDFGDGGTSTQVSPSHTFTSAGAMNVKLVVTSDLGCKDSSTQSIIICPTLNNQAFSINSAASCFAGNYFGVISYFGNTASYPMTYLWNYGDGFTSTLQSPPTHSYAAVGTYTISLTVTLSYPGCSVQTGAYSVSATVQPMPVAAYSISGSSTTMCYASGNSYTFNNTSSIASGSMTYSWDFGDGTTSTAFSPSKTYSAAGVYNVKLIATSNNNCKDSVTQTITLYQNPVLANFQTSTVCCSPYAGGTPSYFLVGHIMDDSVNCYNGDNWFRFWPTVAGSTFTSPSDKYIWAYSDGTADTSTFITHGPYKKFANPGTTYTVQGKILSPFGCSSNTVNHTVTILNSTQTNPVAAIGLHIPAPVAPGSGALYYDINFASLSTVNCGSFALAEWQISQQNPFTSAWSVMYSNNFAGNMPTITDTAYHIVLTLGPLVTPLYEYRLIVTTDQGLKDTAYAYFGSTNSGYTTFRTGSNATGGNTNEALIELFPNPAKDNIKVSVTPIKSGIITIQLYDAMGKLIRVKKVNGYNNLKQVYDVDIKNTVPGTYLILLMDNEGNRIGRNKFIKEK